MFWIRIFPLCFWIWPILAGVRGRSVVVPALIATVLSLVLFSALNRRTRELQVSAPERLRALNRLMMFCFFVFTAGGIAVLSISIQRGRAEQEGFKKAEEAWMSSHGSCRCSPGDPLCSCP